MRARVAYISSLGTTAILVAAALLMLAVVGAIVAFRGWPGAANAQGVQSVPLSPPLSAASETLVVSRVDRTGAGVGRSAGAVAARTAAGRLSTAGLVKVTGPSVVAGVVKVTSGPGPAIQPVYLQSGRPVSSFPPPTGRNPVTVPFPSGSSGGGPNGPVPLPGGAAVAPVTRQVSAIAAPVVAAVPSPPSVVEQVRDALPIP